MEIKTIDWIKDDSGKGKILCPFCGVVWHDEEGEEDFNVCPHIKFVWVDAASIIEYYGEWDTDKFEEDYKKAAIEVFCKDDPRDCEDEDFDEAHPDAMDSEVLKGLTTNDLSCVYEFSESYGPGGVTVYYGVKA